MHRCQFAFLLAATALFAAPALAEDGTYKLTRKDHKFTPSAITIPANTKIRLLVTNFDTTAAEVESDPAGQEVVVFIPALKLSRYEFHDGFNETASKSKLIVQ